MKDAARRARDEFRDLDRRHTELKRQHDEGTLSTEEFDAQLQQMMVRDDEGRWWAKSRKTAEWYYHDGNTWLRGTPPSYQPVAPDYQQNSPTQTTEKARPSRRQAVIVIATVVVALILISLGEVGGALFFLLLTFLICVWIGLRIARAVFRPARERGWVTLIGWVVGVFLWLLLQIIRVIPQLTAGS